MGTCNSTTAAGADELNQSRPPRKVTFSRTHSDSFNRSTSQSDDIAGYEDDSRLNRAPTLNRVIVFKSALADSSDEEHSVENDSTDSVDETNESSKYSLNSDSHLEDDEKRDTPFEFDWMKDLPRSPAESRRKKLNDAVAAEERKKLLEEQEALERKMLEEEERVQAGDQGESAKVAAKRSRSLKELLDHKPPPTDKLLFVDFAKLKFHPGTHKYRTELPRNPEDENLAEAVLESPKFSRPDSFMVFISHEWIGDEIEGQIEKGRRCDTANNDKFQLMVKAIEKAWRELAPGMANCFVWCDHMCLNQDKDVGAYTGVSLLNLNLCNIMRLCDIMLTPVVDLESTKWSYGEPVPSVEEAGKVLCGRDGVDWFQAYKSPSFLGHQDGKNGYLNRAWCRLEMLCNAKVPLLEEWIKVSFADKDKSDSMVAGKIEHEADVVTQRQSFFRGTLLESAKHGMRPHYLYGTKEDEGCLALVKLPRLTKERSVALRAMDGTCHDEEVDKTLIYALLQQIDETCALFRKHNQPEWWELETYTGQRDSMGRRHGVGTYVWPDNSSYTGPWQHGVRSGDNGTLTLANGDTLVGTWKSDRHCGFCTYTALKGDVYFGELNDRLEKHGQGKLEYISGDKYEGYWQSDVRHYKGKFTYKEGDEFVGFFRNNKMNGYGTWQYIDGGEYSGYFKNNRRHGEGTFTTAEGIVFNGFYRCGRKHGRGITTYRDGTVMECEFDQGQQVGSGTWRRAGELRAIDSIQEEESDWGSDSQSQSQSQSQSSNKKEASSSHRENTAGSDSDGEDRLRNSSIDIYPERNASIDFSNATRDDRPYPPPAAITPTQSRDRRRAP